MGVLRGAEGGSYPTPSGQIFLKKRSISEKI